VLPIVNFSSDKEYFRDGWAEELMNALTQLPGLRAMAPTSAFAFRGKEQDIRRIGAELNVENVLFTLAEHKQLRVTERFGRPTVVPPYALPSGDLPGIMLTGRPPSKSERG